MQFVYVDAGLRNEIGHHANCCRAVLRELRGRGLAATVVGFSGVEDALRAELGIVPLLRAYIYYLSDGDPLAGWLNAFEQVAQATRLDLARLTTISANDIVYVAAAYPGQLMGIGQWLADMPRARQPFVVVDLLSHPGVEVQDIPEGQRILPRREDPRAMLYRYAATRISKLNLRRLIVSYADPAGADIYGKVLGRDVISLPMPFDAVTGRRNRTGVKSIRLALLGSQRNEEKGYHLVPAILTGLLQSHSELTILVHNSYPGNFPAAHDAMRTLSQTEPRIVLDERALDSAGWSQCLDTNDLVLCPYSPDSYQFMSSGIHMEAIANAIPSIVPEGTALARALKTFGGGKTFARFETESILVACRGVLDHFDDYAASAYAGSQLWGQIHGAGKLVDALMALAQGHSQSQ